MQGSLICKNNNSEIYKTGDQFLNQASNANKLEDTIFVVDTGYVSKKNDNKLIIFLILDSIATENIDISQASLDLNFKDSNYIATNILKPEIDPNYNGKLIRKRSRLEFSDINIDEIYNSDNMHLILKTNLEKNQGIIKLKLISYKEDIIPT